MIIARSMTVELLKLLNDQSRSFIAQIQGRLSSTGTSATGKTAKSLRYVIEEGTSKIVLEVLGRPYFATVETGRKATPDKKPSRAMINNIKEWVSARGKPESAVWAIATKIQKEGTELFKKGGRTDIYTDQKETFADQLYQSITNEMADEIFKNAKLSFE